MKLLEALNQRLGLELKSEDLFTTAFTHRSYINEHPEHSFGSNERLEFLGDAILQFQASKFLFESFSEFPEGDLTNLRASLVKTPSLAEESAKLGFGQLLLMSRGEELTGGRDREYLLANTFEAFLGALYLEKGITACSEFLQKNLFYKAQELVAKDTFKDAKTAFQELVQEKMRQTPTYKVVGTEGPEHHKIFKVVVFIAGEEYSVGEGNSKQKAEQDAAKKGLNKLQETC